MDFQSEYKNLLTEYKDLDYTIRIKTDDSFFITFNPFSIPPSIKDKIIKEYDELTLRIKENEKFTRFQIMEIQ